MKLQDIDKGINELKGIVSNVNERVQKLAVGIVDHKIAHNDCSRALALVNALPNSFRREFLIGWFQYFGAIGIDVKGQKVRNITDGRNYRPPNIEGAKANNWFEPFNEDNTRKDWYAGPNPQTFEPNTLGNLGDNIIRFADKFLGKNGNAGDLSKTKDNGRGQQVPIYDLTEHERQQAEVAMNTLRKIGLALMAREEAERATNRVVELNDFVDKVMPAMEELSHVGDTEQEELETEAAVG